MSESLVSIQVNNSAIDISPSVDSVREFLDRATVERQSSADLEGLSTGLQELDFMTTGIRAGELWVTGALPGRGKTAFATQVAVTNVTQGHPVLFFSLEMSKHELIRRIVAMGSRVGATSVRRLRGISPEKWETVKEYAAEISKWPLYIDDSPSLTPAQLCAKARAAIRRHKIELMVVDYLQLMTGQGKELRERVGFSANALRVLAKSTGVPILLLSQLRRPAGLNDRPSMLELRESGEIEAHANTVLLLYQPIGDDDQPLGQDEIIVGKQRNGPLTSIPVVFDKFSLKFMARDRNGDADSVPSYGRKRKSRGNGHGA